MAIYLRARDGAYAERVLVAGDPGRIARLASTLQDVEMITEHRGLLGFTGLYKGVPVSVQSSGMGCPSMTMVGAELISYGVKQIIRIGTCSAFKKGVNNGDLIIVTGCAPADGTTKAMASGSPYACIPDFHLVSKLVSSAESVGGNFHIGPVVTVDVEPHLNAISTKSWREQGLLAVEMESAALFHLALRSSCVEGSELQAGCILTVSDGIGENGTDDQKYMTDEELQSATDVMHQIALEALISK